MDSTPPPRDSWGRKCRTTDCPSGTELLTYKTSARSTHHSGVMFFLQDRDQGGCENIHTWGGGRHRALVRSRGPSGAGTPPVRWPWGGGEVAPLPLSSRRAASGCLGRSLLLWESFYFSTGTSPVLPLLTSLSLLQPHGGFLSPGLEQRHLRTSDTKTRRCLHQRKKKSKLHNSL